jgi:antirestriction protein ArdC
MARNTKPRKTLAEQKAEAAAILEQLHAQVAELATGEEWQNYLAYASSFRSYSPRNVMLMLMQWEVRRRQNPERPPLTLPAAHSTWADKGGWVRKGEKGLGVLAPVRVIDRDAEPNADGSPKRKLIGWKMISRTFDASQIEGIEHPANPACPTVLEGDGDEALWNGLVRIAEATGYRVEVTDYCLPAHGDCHFGEKRLRVAESIPEAQKVKTLAHELAHALMHSPEEYLIAHAGSLNVIEVEAESVAFTVMSLLGRDTAAYSVGYVAGWAQGDGELIAKTAERVIATAQRIVTALEGDRPVEGNDADAEEVAA